MELENKINLLEKIISKEKIVKQDLKPAPLYLRNFALSETEGCESGSCEGVGSDYGSGCDRSGGCDSD